MQRLKAMVLALSVTTGLVALVLFAETENQKVVLATVIVLGSAVWAALDSARLELRKYEGGTPEPGMVFVAVLLLWPVYFPSYLDRRWRCLAGVQPLLPQYEGEVPPHQRGLAGDASAGASVGLDDESWRGTPEGRAARLPWVLVALLAVLGLIFSRPASLTV